MNAPRVMIRLACLAGLLLGAAMPGAEPAAVPDQPARVIQTIRLDYPEILIRRNIYEGQARVLLQVDADGHLVDWLVQSYTHAVLAREATDVLHHWRFEPAIEHGQAVPSRIEMVFNFRVSGVTASIATATVIDQFAQANQTRWIWPPTELDQPPLIVKSVRPAPDAPADAPLRAGQVVVDFYIDQSGHARLLMVTRSDDEAFAKAAIEAVSRWRFSIPIHQGQPVITHMTQVFNFQPIAETETKSDSKLD